MAGLHWADYLIFVCFLMASLSIGFYHAFSGNKQRTTQEFIMADRNLKVLPTMLSILVSFQSALMILGNTAEVYSYGTQHWFGVMMGFPLAILLAERLIVPWIFPLKLTSVFEYLQLRYSSRPIRIVGAVLGIISGLLYIGPAMYAPSLALEAATGFPTKASIPIMAIAATTYTALGGMRAVIWTDVFQAGIMLCGILSVLIKGCIEVGGISEAFNYAQNEGRIVGLSFSADPRERLTVWGLVIGWGVTWSFIYGLQQASAQRYSATASLKDARLSLLLNIPSLVVLVSLSFTVGIIAIAYFAQEGCDPLVNGDISSSNQLLPYFVKIVFASNHGFSGLFLATLYSGALSSVSSSLSGCAANAWEDILKYYMSNMTDFRAAMLNKALGVQCGIDGLTFEFHLGFLSVVLFGAIGTAVAFLAAMVPGPVTQVSISFGGSVTGPLYAMFVLGGISATANWQGALSGCVVGVILNLWVVSGAPTNPAFSPVLPPIASDNCPMLNGTLDFTQANMTSDPGPKLHGIQNLYALSYMWYTVSGFCVTFGVGWVVSIIFNKVSGNREKKVIEKRLRIPWRAMFTFATLPDEQSDTDLYYDFEVVKKCAEEKNKMLPETKEETELT